MLYSVESQHALLKRYITSSQGDLLTVWLQIRQAVSSQIENIKTNAARERIQTPLHLNRVQYQACFGYITNTALRLADLNYQSAEKPLKPCTGVFKRTTGLPCAHKINDIQFAKESLYPSDFHRHWHWDRYVSLAEPVLEPLRIVSYSASTSSRTQSTRRIPSGFEASETRERRCGLCNQPGHTRASMRCTVNIRRLQAEFAPHEPLESTLDPELASQVIPRATVQAILDSASRSTSQSALQSALQSVLDTGNPQFIPKETIQRILESHPAPPPTEPVRELTPDTRPIWPGRIELIYKQYIVEKEAWLTAHPTVRPSNYREKRGLESYSPRWCKEQSRYLPDHRIDLETETILKGRPHWTTEEIYAWLDYEALQEQEVERQVEAELIAAGGFGQSRERGIRGVYGRIETDFQALKEQYRFVGITVD
jgi:hypothetical protein